jgi:hypothetical protein
VSTNGRIRASRGAQGIGSIKNLFVSECSGGNNYRESIISHRFVHLLPGAAIDGSANITRMILWIFRRRIDRHPALSMSKLAINHSPCMGAWSGFSDRPTARFGIFQGFANVLVRMNGHLSATFSVRCHITHSTTLPQPLMARLTVHLPCVGSRRNIWPRSCCPTNLPSRTCMRPRTVTTSARPVIGQFSKAE